MRRNALKRLFAGLLALVMVMTFLPATAFADDDLPTEEQAPEGQAELRLRVQKSSLILCNCLDLFIGKGQVPGVVSKSLADGPWPWLGEPHPACFTTGAPLRQQEQRIPATFCVDRSPEHL